MTDSGTLKMKNIKSDPWTGCVQPCTKIPSLLKTINILASVWLQAAKQDWKLFDHECLQSLLIKKKKKLQIETTMVI